LGASGLYSKNIFHLPNMGLEFQISLHGFTILVETTMTPNSEMSNNQNPVKDEVREAIISAAGAVFHKYGFRKTTMDEIAIAAHKGKSSIYYYFSSKEEVFQAVVEKEALALRARLTDAVGGKDEPREKLQAYLSAKMLSHEGFANFYDAINNDYLSHLEFILKIREAYSKEETKMIQNILVDGVTRKIFQVEDTELAAIVIVIAMKGLEIPLLTTSRSENIALHLDRMLDILLYGIVIR
jgi:AcrR family transcriptional regulator